MDTLPLPDVGDTLARIAILSPAAQITALLVIGGVVGLWIWSRRPQPGPDAATVVEALRVTAQAQAETSASMTAIVQQNERIAEDVKAVVSEVRSLTQLVIQSLKPTA
ncbi:hypothetical protein J2848_005684 [Azospirillum lipoferum]|uniref:Chemotaxis protein n=1 Tax=Azospirillum lipoferum TaxID=193 RepID=A0A5A9GI55_AZOLI|nr:MULTISPECIES: hypothetical protein [Azospirillum]KAA0592959.1 hypothetical protein FZ942_25895 [Azospirillum lipoferum]MCP1613983.1 hypothetical protein [Azospirillum lipoferum]MDW5537625.1 hypothetical protein [Azospirillum sp. NL1]